MSIASADEADYIQRPDPVSPEQFQLRSFSQVLANAEDGRLNADLSDALAEITSLMNEAIQNDRRAKASITVTVNFKVDRGVVELDAAFETKLPQPTRHKTLLHVSGNFLSTRDPRQRDLPLRGLPTPEPRDYRSV